MSRDPERDPRFLVPLAIVLVITAYITVQRIDDLTDAALRGLPADYAQR